MKPKYLILTVIIIALIWFGFFWNPIIAVMGALMVILVSAVTRMIK